MKHLPLPGDGPRTLTASLRDTVLGTKDPESHTGEMAHPGSPALCDKYHLALSPVSVSTRLLFRATSSRRVDLDSD